ncbi:MAG: hypothetical protein LBI84_00590 [Propionibacteriaceae bacterium]|jgi:hypothetical protein|nr:hypothetical protein [Propionibacteriaceae bacterium]
MNKSFSRRWRAAAVAAALAAVAAGCTGQNAPAPSESADSSTRRSEPATYLTALGESADARMSAAAVALGIGLSDNVRTDAYGDWNPLQLSDDSPVLDLDLDKLLTPATEEGQEVSFSEPWVESAWSVVAAFLVNEWADSEVAWDDTAFNRATAAERITDGGYFSQEYGGSFYSYLDPDGGLISFTAHGSWALDQDYEAWRQEGLPAAFFADVEEAETAAQRADRHRYIGRLTPAAPIPYTLGQQRVYVTGLEAVSVAAGQATEELQLTASISYFRPIQVEGADTPRYEQSHAYITFIVAAVDQTSVIVGFSEGSVTHSDGALLSGQEMSRLPLLTASDAADPAPAAGSPVTQADWAYSLPKTAAADEDGSCAVTLPDGYEGQFTSYDLPEAASGLPACLQVWTYPTDVTEIGEGWVAPSTTLWGFERGGAVGVISVDSYVSVDDILIDLIDQQGQRLRLEATVPAGTGQAFAASLADSLHLA